MAEQNADYSARIPVYATNSFKLLGLSWDGVGVVLIGTAILQPIVGGWSLGLSMLVAFFIEQQIQKAGLPAGTFQYKLSQFAMTPWAQRYMPVVGRAMQRAWRSRGAMPPTPLGTRYTR